MGEKVIVVKHRGDQLLQKSVKRGCPPSGKGTFIELVTVPTHRALLSFVEQRLVGHEFPSQEDLQTVLATWPDFALTEGGLPQLAKGFESLRLTSRGTIACPGGLGGDFDVAVWEVK